MSVKTVEGNLFESEAQTITNAINCVGVMGGGIAGEFAQRFPAMVAEYGKLCHERKVKMGQPYLWKNEDGKDVLNFPTMYYPGMKASLPMIDRGLAYLAGNYEGWGIESVAMPALGCGIGRLRFSQVETAVKVHFADLSLPVELYAPHAPPAPKVKPPDSDVKPYPAEFNPSEAD